MASPGRGWADWRPPWASRRCPTWRGTPAAAIAGFAALGFGLAGVVPTLFRSGADQPGVSTGPGLAAVSSLGYLGCLGGPPLIGGVAQLTSLRLACGLLSLAGLLVVLLATFAGPSRPRERVPVQSWVS
ncbi:MAG TPA: hypothetical protein VF781_00640 [Solirubrobacteraceae bacterium]